MNRRMMVEAARAFYLNDEAKVDIANRLGISRFKVARLLEQARAEGIVQITIHDDTIRDDSLAADLAAHLALSECTVVAGAADESTNRRTLAQAAAVQVSHTVQAGEVFGFSWGRTLADLGAHLEPLPESTLVALTGSVGTDFEQSPVEVLRAVARRSQVRTMSIFAPLFVESPATAAALTRDPAIASVLSAYARLSLAVLSVGSWRPRITQVESALTPGDVAALDAAGARAELVGTFIDDEGHILDIDATRRRIAVSAAELYAVPRVLAVAGGEAKAPALAAVSRSRLITDLITDERTARVLMDLPGVPVDRPREMRARRV